MEIINTRLMRHPLNWLTVASMALLFFYTAHLVIAYFSGYHPGAVGASNTEGIAGPGTNTADQTT